MSIVLIKQSKEKEEIELFEGYVDLFKKLHADNIFIEKMVDGKLEAVDSNKVKVSFTFGLLDIQGTAKSLEDEMITYRNELRENMSKMDGIIEVPKEQLDKLSKSFSIIKEK